MARGFLHAISTAPGFVSYRRPRGGVLYFRYPLSPSIRGVRKWPEDKLKRIQERVRKLFNVANGSPYEEEARLAREQAEKLLAKYALAGRYDGGGPASR